MLAILQKTPVVLGTGTLSIAMSDHIFNAYLEI